jgi:uncharacterized protein YjbI with pentapeptide repeats
MVNSSDKRVPINCSWKQQGIAGLDFSNSCVRGKNFTHLKLDLSGANFYGTDASLPHPWHICLTISFLLLSTLTAVSLSAALEPVIKGIERHLVSNILVFLMQVILLISFTLKGFKGALITIGISFIIAFIVSTPLMITRIHNEIVPFVFTGIFSLTFSFSGIVIFAFIISVIFILTEWQAGVVAVVIAMATSIAGILPFTNSISAHLKAIALLVTTIVISFYIALRSLSNDQRFELVRSLAIRCCGWRGTSFRDVNLTDANFTQAKVKNIDLRGATLIRTCWLNAKGLDYACVNDGYLQYPQIRKLVTTLQGQEQKFDNLNLEGVNLKSANLQDASFIGTNLNNANLQDADLSRAVLKQVQLDSADLTGACLTGAYIEDWGITGTTKLNGVRCEYVYMHVPTKNHPEPLRKPDNHNEIFEDGDFANFIKPIVDTIDLYHNQGVDPRAIAISFKQLAENNPEAELEIVAMEKRGEDKFLLRAKTAPDADRSQLSAEYFSTYNYIKTLPGREIKLLLAERDSQIRRLENMVMTALERPSFYAESIHNQGDIVSEKSENSIYNLNRAKFGGGFAGTGGTQTGGILNDYSSNSNLSEAASEIQQLLKQLELSNQATTSGEKMAVVAKAVDEIENNPALKARVIEALNSGGTEALKQAINHPLAKNMMPIIEEWTEAE